MTFTGKLAVYSLLIFMYSALATKKYCVPNFSLPLNSELSHNSTRKRVYNSGEQVYFQCADGFEPHDSRSRRISMRCSDKGRWERTSKITNLTCSKKPCKLDQLSCKGGLCVRNTKWCNCRQDCPDKKDERACFPFQVNTTSGLSGVITSPGYPYGYPGNVSCTYVIMAYVARTKALATSKVKLKFLDFDLQAADQNRGCEDFVKVDHVNSFKSQKCKDRKCMSCGRKAPLLSNPKVNWIYIHFTSKHSTREHRGFKLFWQLTHRMANNSTTVKPVHSAMVGNRTAIANETNIVSGYDKTTNYRQTDFSLQSLWWLILPVLILITVISFYMYLRWRRKNRPREDTEIPLSDELDPE